MSTHPEECLCVGCTGSGLQKPLTAEQWRGSLAYKLGSVVDRVRGIPTRLGFRPYAVLLVHTRWSGGRRGVGHELIVREVLITPTPVFTDIADLNDLLIPPGRDEQGTIRVEQVSMRYTEDQLKGRDPGGGLPPDVEFFWEIRLPQNDGTFIRRRFTLSGPPSLKAESAEWVVDLMRGTEDRMRDGTPGTAEP